MRQDPRTNVAARVGQYVLTKQGHWVTRSKHVRGGKDKGRVSVCIECQKEYPYVRGRKLCSSECYSAWRKKYVFKRKNLLFSGNDLFSKPLRRVTRAATLSHLSPEQIEIRRVMRELNWRST
jgi:hypothetical protein